MEMSINICEVNVDNAQVKTADRLLISLSS